MPTAALSGMFGAFNVRASGEGSDTKIGEITEWTLEVSRDVAEATSKDSAGWKESIPGYRSWTGTATARYNASASQAKLWTALVGDTSTTYVLTGKFDLGTASGSDRYTGSCYVTKFSVVSPDGAEVCELSLELEGTAALTKGTV
jgi:predicted secreted protein